MAVIPARRSPDSAKRTGFERLGGYPKTNKTCWFWQFGTCTRNPCKYVHAELAAPQPKPSHLPKQSHLISEDGRRFHKPNIWKNSYYNSSVSTPLEGKNLRTTRPQTGETEVAASRNQYIRRTEDKRKATDNLSEDIQKASKQRLLKHTDSVNVSEDFQKEQQKLVKLEESGGEDIQEASKKRLLKHEDSVNLNEGLQKAQQKLVKSEGSGSLGCEQVNDFSFLATLEGHTKTVSGIALPSGSNKLYSCGIDKSLRVWDCNSGQCEGVVDFDMECGTMISEGPWLFVGMQNVIKAWNFQTNSELSFDGPIGKVSAIDVYSNMLFSGSEDGTILGWRTASETSSPELVASLKGHNGRVLSLTVGCTNRLFSGSADRTIRVWDLDSLECIHILHSHTDNVTSLIVWDSYLLSGSLDNTIKAWAVKDGKLEVVCEHTEDSGVTALCGMYNAKDEPVLLCSCEDSTVRVYDLPSFSQRGKIFSKGQVQSIHSGPGGLFFIGDATGRLSVWKFDETQQKQDQN